MNAFVGLLHRAKFLMNDNSSTILTALGVTGTASTAYLTGRASFKAARVIDEANQNPPVDPDQDPVYLTKKEMVRLIWPLYIPATITGITTIVAIISANRIDSHKIAALTMASSVSERALQEYKTKVVEKLGERQETKIRDEIAQDRVNQNPPKPSEVVLVVGEVLCQDKITGRYFTSTVEKIKGAENDFNHGLLNHGGSSLAEFYSDLGLAPTDYTEMVGWNSDNLVKVQFSTTMTPEGKPCLVVDFNYPPTASYMQLH
jgi:Family of unknown function (DUF6353)